MMRPMSYPAPSDPWNIDQYRCAEHDGAGDRRQMVVGYDGQHVVQGAGLWLVRPVGAELHTRPPDHVLAASAARLG